MENNNNKKTKIFVERELNDDVIGEYDDEGFFNTPNGSFWDPDGVYFNKEGYDKHGGFYDDNQEYVPGDGWDEVKNCYKDEYNDDYDYDDEYGSDHDNLDDDDFGDIDLDKIQDEEKLLFKNMNDIEKINEDPTKIIHHIEETDEVKIKDDEKKEDKKEEPKKEEPKKKTKLAMLLDEVQEEDKKKKKKESDKKNKKP